MQALARRALRLEAADAGERFHEHAFEVRQLHDATARVAHRREVAHLGDGEQPLVLRILPRDTVEEVHVLNRRQALNVEVAQPPQVHPLAHHRVQPAIQLLLRVAVRRRAVGEMLHAADAERMAGARHDDDDPPNAAREGEPS